MSTAEINVPRSHLAERHPLVAHAARIALGNCLDWLFWGWMIALGTISAILLRQKPEHAVAVWLVCAFLTGLVAPVHFVEHFVSPRAPLTPRYRQVHLAALAIYAVGMFGLLWVWIACWSTIDTLPIVGAALLAFSLGCWGLARRALVVAFYLLVCLLAINLSGVGFPLRPLFFFLTPDGMLILALAVACWRLGRRMLIVTLLIVTAWSLVRLGKWPNALVFFAGPLGQHLSLVLSGLVLWRFGTWLARLDEDNPAYETLSRVSAHARFIVQAPRRKSWAGPEVTEVAGSITVPGLSGIVYRLQDGLLATGLRSLPGRIGWGVLRWELAWPGLVFLRSECSAQSG